MYKSELKSLTMAVHLHLYYFEMWETVQDYLKNIGDYPYHLYVTITRDNLELVERIKDFHPDTVVWLVENRGYDIGPFVYFLHHIDLSQYDLVLKIHTKNNRPGIMTVLNNRLVSRENWFRLLFEGVLGSEKVFFKNINAFKSNPMLGMVGSKYLITSDPKSSLKVSSVVKKLMLRLGYRPPQKITFVAGSMFMIRSSLLQKIKDNYVLADFSPTDGTIKDGTLAHVLERVFGCLTIAEGYEVKGFDRNRHFEFYERLQYLRRLIWHRKITRHNNLLVKVCKIPVYHRKLA
ncbi:MAG: hypothetical protein IJ479_01700 [Alphaproteobacteria bacterium]|nr:hypothetical protein [Alphaproteobacteria bacterium]